MSTIETRIQQAEHTVAQMQAVLDRTQQALQKAEVAVQKSRQSASILSVVLLVATGAAAAVAGFWALRRARQWLGPMLMQ